MKTYFKDLFDYDRWANLQVLDAMNAEIKSAKATQLMAHILAAQQIWLNRCMYLPQPPLNLWEPGEVDTSTFGKVIPENHDAWVNYTGGLADTDFGQIISYKRLNGEAFEDTVLNILTHVINHGTHHRAQIGQLLKFAGVESLPPLDYIFYIREKNL